MSETTGFFTAEIQRMERAIAFADAVNREVDDTLVRWHSDGMTFGQAEAIAKAVLRRLERHKERLANQNPLIEAVGAEAQEKADAEACQADLAFVRQRMNIPSGGGGDVSEVPRCDS